MIFDDFALEPRAVPAGGEILDDEVVVDMVDR
jgi:hypothetical protein